MTNSKVAAAALSLMIACPPTSWAGFAPQTTALPGSAPQGVNYQGRLEQNGAPVSGNHDMIFKIYGALSGGSPLWTSSTIGVAVTVGLFNAVIPIPLTALVGGNPAYLEVVVDGVTLAPREPLQSVPYALVAKSVEGTIDLSTAGLNILPNPSGGSALFISSTTGVIGVGTTSPAGRLDVNGSMVLRGSMTVTGISAPTLSSAGQGVLYFDSSANRFMFSENGAAYLPLNVSAGVPGPFTIVSGSMTVATTLGVGGSGLQNGTLVVLSTSGTSGNPVADFRNNAGTSVMQVQQGGSIGVGTISPQAVIDVKDSAGRSTLMSNLSVNVVGASIYGAPTSNNVTNNAYFDVVSGWNRFTTANPASLINANSGVISFQNAAAGANPITWNEYMRVHANGAVGIGTPLPTNTLDVNGGVIMRSSVTVAQIAAPAVSAANTGALYFDSTSKKFFVSENGGAYTALLGGAGGASGSFTVTSSMTVLGAAGIGGSNLQNGTLVVVSTSATNGNPVASFRNNAGTDVFRVQQDGTTGIGTSNPASKLHMSTSTLIVDGVNSYNAGIHVRGANTNGAGIQLQSEDTGGHKYALFSSGSTNTGGAGNLGIYDDTLGQHRFYIMSSGFTGIGTTSPTNLLDVNGGAIVRSSLTVAGMAAPPVSSAGQGALYLNSTSNKFFVSENGGAYTPLFGSVPIPLTVSSSMTVTGTAGIGASNTQGATLVVVSTSATSAHGIADFRDNSGNVMMRVQNNGSVGIGTSVPTSRFDLATNDGSSVLNIRDTRAGGASLQITAGSPFVFFSQNGSAGDMRFLNGTGNWYMKPNANMGLNTSSPMNMLDVNGDAIVRSSMTVVGHIHGKQASAPLLGACTSGTIGGTSSDVAGSITFAAGAGTTCAVTFGTAYPAAPICTVTGSGTAVTLGVSALATTGFTISSSAAFPNPSTVYYVCVGL